MNSIIVNVVLSVAKFAAGIIAGSGAMISDAVHSASDVFSTVVVMIGVKWRENSRMSAISMVTNGWNV